jgi:hypothetical protein
MKKDSPRRAIFRREFMRLVISAFAIALAAAVAAPAGATLDRTPGTDAVQLVSGRGRALVRSQGFFFGKVRRGRVVATQNVRLRNCKQRHKVADSGLVSCRGRGLRFVSPAYPARWRIALRGRGINASGIVRGCLVLNGADSGETGKYSIGTDDDFESWPRTRWSHRLGDGKC